MRKVLVVDDERTVAHVLKGILEEHGCEVTVARSAEEGLHLCAQSVPDVALLDIVLPGMNGLELLERIKSAHPDTEVLIMTSHASIDTAIRAIRQGAYDYLRKPFEEIEDVWITVSRAFEKRSLALGNRGLIAEQDRKNRELSAVVMRLSSLIEAGHAMGYFHALPDLLDFVLGLVARELDVERASLMLREEESDELTIAAHRGLSGVDVGNVRVRLGEGIAGMVAQSGEPFLVTDVRNDPRIREPLDPRLSDSFISAPIVLSLPIKSRESILGVINITNRRSGDPFDDDDLLFLGGLASQLAVAVERTRHFETLKKTYESLKAAQEQMVRAERLKAVGEMAAGVAHDFNNALSVILGRAQTVLQKIAGPDPDLAGARTDLQMVLRISGQVAEAIRRIQDYTRIRKDASHSLVDLNSVVRDAIEMTRPKWSRGHGPSSRDIAIRMELGTVPAISGSAQELAQAIHNIIFNAVEAMPEGGTLTFRTLEADGCALLEVTDTGVGMSAETREHLFEPFFTTKEFGQGLGASIIYGIVSRHRGDVAVSSTEGAGTTVRIRLPRALPDRPRPQASLPAPDHSSQGLRILLVEDEQLVRDLFEESLAADGHRVSSFARGSEALAGLERGTFDVVVTDLVMPEISGLDVAKGVKALDRDLPVILLSGWAAQQDDEEVRGAGVDVVLAKPCLIETLLDAVRKAGSTRAAHEAVPR